MEIIAKHLDKSIIAHLIEQNLYARCVFTGKHITEGVHRKNIISDRFTDHEFLRYPSNYLSVEAALCVAPVIKSEKGYNSLRNYSYLATENSLSILQRDMIMEVLLSPPEPPFIIAVTFANKKHTAFKTSISLNKNSFIVTTDKGNVRFSRELLMEIYPIISAWYTIIPEKKETSIQPTWFTKDDILHQCHNFKRILEYGAEKYSRENLILSKYRNTLFFSLIVHALNKTQNA